MEYCHNVLKMHFDSIPFLFLNMMKKRIISICLF